MARQEYLHNYAREHVHADSWRDFENRFFALAREEQGRTDVITKGETVGRIDRVLRASCTYKEHAEGWERGKPEQGLVCLLDTPPHGVWNYCSDGISENFFERVRLCVAEAGRTLADCPNGADSEDFWLHRLYIDLLKNNSDLLFCASKEGGMILSVCVASATFCSRLQRKAISAAALAATPIGREAFVRAILGDQGISVHDWATKSGVDFHTANNYLHGKTKPYPGTRKKLAAGLGIPIKQLPE